MGAAEEALLDSLMVEMMVELEIQEMLRVLEASEDIEPETYDKVKSIVEQRMEGNRWRA